MPHLGNIPQQGEEEQFDLQFVSDNNSVANLELSKKVEVTPLLYPEDYKNNSDL